MHQANEGAHREPKAALGLGIWAKVCEWNHVQSYHQNHHLIKHLQVLQIWDSLWLLTEKVNLEKQVVEVDELELTSWAFHSKERETEDGPPQNKYHIVAHQEVIMGLN